MRAVVTGGAGFIGSHLVTALLPRATVTIVDDLSSGHRRNVPPGATLIELDVAGPAAVQGIAAAAPELVIHCAAQTSVPRSFVDPELDARTNIIGTLHVLQGALAAGCRRLVYVTTGGALYGEPLRLPCDEDHPIRPISPYGLSKWTGEELLRLAAPSDLAVTVLRLANVYGPRQGGEGEGGVVNRFIKAMLSGAPVEIHGDGEQTRDFVYVRDVVSAVMASIDHARGVTVNIGTGVGVSVNELYATLAGIIGYDLPPVDGPPRIGDVRHSRLDPRRAQATIGWEPSTRLAAGLRATVDAERDLRPA